MSFRSFDQLNDFINNHNFIHLKKIDWLGDINLCIAWFTLLSNSFQQRGFAIWVLDVLKKSRFLSFWDYSFFLLSTPVSFLWSCSKTFLTKYYAYEIIFHTSIFSTLFSHCKSFIRNHQLYYLKLSLFCEMTPLVYINWAK